MPKGPKWNHIARYCDTIAAIPHIVRYFFREVNSSPKWCDTPPCYLVSHRHICAIPPFATYRAIIVRYPPQKQAQKSFAILSLEVSRDMKTIAAGPPSKEPRCIEVRKAPDSFNFCQKGKSAINLSNLGKVCRQIWPQAIYLCSACRRPRKLLMLGQLVVQKTLQILGKMLTKIIWRDP